MKKGVGGKERRVEGGQQGRKRKKIGVERGEVREGRE